MTVDRYYAQNIERTGAHVLPRALFSAAFSAHTGGREGPYVDRWPLALVYPALIQHQFSIRSAFIQTGHRPMPPREIEGRMEASGRALLDHWRWAAGRGLMNAHTANGLRSACAKVLGVIDGWETLDVRALDVDEAITRFQNAKKRDYIPAVLDTYKRRFRIALASYVAYLQDPGGWTPGIPERPGKGERKQPRGSSDPARASLPATPFVEFPFPLREGQIARLVLPSDLKAVEVRRLTAFLNTLVLDREGAPRPGEPG